MTKTGPRGNLRRYARSPLELPVRVAEAENSVNAVIEFDTQDLSVGGAFVRSDLLFEVGEELSLTLAFPDGREVTARGRVVRVARESGDEGVPGMGVEFVNLEDADREAIRALVARGNHG